MFKKSIVVFLLVIVIILIAQPVMAWGLQEAPPQLSDQEATRWINALPTARPYLARLYDVPRDIAIQYGARYEKPVMFDNPNKENSIITDYNAHLSDTLRWNIDFEQNEVVSG